MKDLLAKVCLIIVALFLSFSVSLALPSCLESPTRNYQVISTWNECVGKHILRIHGYSYYFGEWRNGEGLYSDMCITLLRQESVWRNKKFHLTKKIPYSKIWSKKSLLKLAFTKFFKVQCNKIKINLVGLGYYHFVIYGLYGKSTSTALKGFNRQNLKDFDLNKPDNIARLIYYILDFKSVYPFELVPSL